MSYQVHLTTQAQKDLGEIPKVEKNKIKRKLFLLEKEIRIGKKLEGKLSNLFSLKAWPYRIIYLIDKKNEAWVTHIMHRKEVYTDYA
ncbi:MAG: hypothetical protein ACD_37C00509G0002 [uncultured bacterium]|nr:MAG: hypothetical protein ACD_37C00509G0002 [uncultured bacterium]